MPKAALYNPEGIKVGDVDLKDDVFGVPLKESLLHQAVVRHLANQRAGTAATKTRGQVRGGGRKPWRQKGTGRARVGAFALPFGEVAVQYLDLNRAVISKLCRAKCGGWL